MRKVLYGGRFSPERWVLEERERAVPPRARKPARVIQNERCEGGERHAAAEFKQGSQCACAMLEYDLCGDSDNCERIERRPADKRKSQEYTGREHRPSQQKQ